MNIEDFAKMCLMSAVWNTPTKPNTTLLIAYGQLRFILIIIHYFNNWVEAKPLAMITSFVIHNFIWIDIICKYGILMVIITDNRLEFVEKSLRELCKLQGIQLKSISANHPQSNGQLEAANKKIISLVKKKVEGVKAM